MRTTPDLCDEMPNDVHILAPIFKTYGTQKHFGGPIVTVQCFEDNSLIKSLSVEQGNGQILVVDGGGSLKKALMGDQIAAAFVANGWAGIVINGCVRDVEILNSLPLGIRALNSTPLKTERRGQGHRDLEIEMAGVRLHTGQYMVVDETGILASHLPIHK